MTEEDLVREMLHARTKYYRSITYVMLGLVSVCVLAMVGTIYLPTHTEPEVKTLLITLTSGLFGSLLTIVTQGIQAARRLRSDEELQTIAEEIEAGKAKRRMVIKEELEAEQNRKVAERETSHEISPSGRQSG